MAPHTPPMLGSAPAKPWRSSTPPSVVPPGDYRVAGLETLRYKGAHMRATTATGVASTAQ